ncbi:MAG: hypothetical protein OXI54_08630 [Chloroflexota bacterium]|nr:hypothetical protein [Chloroflexota bacterium]MDE2684201.1 hypothetical protein [Chloroflexota bacterium]
MNQRNRSNDERQWTSFPSVPLERVRPHFWTFSICFVATLIFYTFVHVVFAENPDWQKAPSAIMGDTTRAGAFWLFASPILVEGAVMVFGWLYSEKKRQEGHEEGREEGRAERDAEWDAWNQRRMEADANGEPFTEPPPSQRNGSSGS